MVVQRKEVTNARWLNATMWSYCCSSNRISLDDCCDVSVAPQTFHFLECPPGFDYLPEVGSCYKLISERMNWDDATKKCRQMMPGAHLAAITSQAEDNAIARYLQSQFSSKQKRDIHAQVQLHFSRRTD